MTIDFTQIWLLYSSEFDLFDILDKPIRSLFPIFVSRRSNRAARWTEHPARGAIWYGRAWRGAAPRRVLPVEIDFRTELKLKSRSRNREKKWPISLVSAEPSLSRWPRRRRSQAGSRGAGEAQSKTRPAKMADSAPLSGSLTPLENTLLTTRRYVLHTPPRAIPRLGDALVYFAHRRHRRSSPSSSVSSSSTKGNRDGPLPPPPSPLHAVPHVVNAWDTWTRLRRLARFVSLEKPLHLHRGR